MTPTMNESDDTDTGLLDSSTGSMRTRGSGRRSTAKTNSSTPPSSSSSSSKPSSLSTNELLTSNTTNTTIVATNTNSSATSASSSSGRMSTRRSRSPALPPSSSTGGPSSTGSATRSSGRRSANTNSIHKLVAINSSGVNSGKKELTSAAAIAAAVADTPIPRKRGRPPGRLKSTGGSSKKYGGGIGSITNYFTPASNDEKKKSERHRKNHDRNNNKHENNDTVKDDRKSLAKASSSAKQPKQPKKPRPLVLLGPQPRGLYECDYCGSDLTLVPRIRCAVCPDFDLCLECFATEDHEHMARYKREEEARRRKDAAKMAALVNGGVPLEEPSVLDGSASKRGGKTKRGRGVRDKEDEDALGSYVGGVWVPYFRHNADHGYLVADSTRYMMFPSFRGVRKVETIDILDGGGKKKESVGRAEDVMLASAPTGKSKEEAGAKQERDVDEAATLGEKRINAPATKTDLNDDAMDVDTNTKDERESKKLSTEKDCDNATEATFGTTNADASKPSKGSLKAGAKIGTKPRKYRVTDDSRSAWTAEEDLRLLDAILTCGLGNWPDIAEHVNGGTSGEGPVGGAGTSSDAAGGGGNNVAGAVVGGGKTDKRCMERYLDDFMGRYGHILPPYTMVPDGVKEDDADVKPAAAASATESSDGESEAGVGRRKRPRRSAASAGGLAEDDKLAPGFRKTKFKVVPTEELEDFRGVWPHPYIPPIAGVAMGDEVGRDLWYRSEQSYVRQTTASGTSKVDAETIRREFMERRAKNLAGYEAKVLPPRLDDTKNLPGAELAGYMPRRGDFDMEWDNEAEKTISEMEFSAEDTRADRDLKLDVIRIFNAKLEEREKRKNFIVERGLLNYRENQEKMWQLPPDERHLVLRMRMFARFQTQEEHDAFVNKILEAKRLRKEIAKLQLYRRLGITSLAEAERYEVDKSRRELHRNAWIKKEQERKKAGEEAARAAKDSSVAVASVSSGATASAVVPAATPAVTGAVPAGVGFEEGVCMVSAAANQSLQVWKQFKSSNKSSYENKKGDKDDSSGAAKFTIRDKPGYELLSKKEVGLCKRLRLLPRQYLDVKKALISESLKLGIISNGDPGGGQKQNSGSRSIYKIDIRQRDGIIDFVLEAGWIPTRPNVC